MLVLISGLVLLLTSAALVGYQYWLFRQTMRSTLSVRGRILATNSPASLAFANDAAARELLSALRADPHIVAAALYDKNGHLFATYPANLPGGALPPTPGPDGYRFERGKLIGFQPVAEAGSQRLGYRLEADRSEEHTSELQSRLHLVCRLLLEKKKNNKN